MYLENLETARSAVAAPTLARRSLSGDFVFITQNERVAHAAEGCIDVLRAANRMVGDKAYAWSHVCGADALSQAPICGPDQTLVLVGGLDTPWRPTGAALNGLRAGIRNAARVCVVGSAIFVPLVAGVLGAKQVAVHPDFRPGVGECGRGLDMVEAATCHHKSLSSAISPAAAMRMIVELVGAREGEFTRAALSRYLGLSEPESETPTGEHWRYKRMAQGNLVISEALQIMLDHLEDTLTVGQIADILEVSPRKLERGFSELLEQTPLKVYRDLRLERARSLLTQTSMPLNEVSVACGFSNVTLMKKWFCRKYGETPEAVRQHAYGGSRAA
ncbi:helix-turn-helix domain-containing protein [Roseovarius sp. SYSU LYC5161]|jgi:transcriptional regulator GlxA family with amidase domain|uniref:helix-turn-helix domain-containing protein n=1 Tax=Roseovarius halophilus (ex Wu et al. 2025) TaxID=3376060 RepID=UPI002871E2FA|nr:helix-turn-helix domain-containing protein [Roseovarius sp.]